MCVAVTEVVSPDTAAPVAPPVIISPIADTSAREGEPARFQCRVRGDGKIMLVFINVSRWRAKLVFCSRKQKSMYVFGILSQNWCEP